MGNVAVMQGGYGGGMFCLDLSERNYSSQKVNDVLSETFHPKDKRSVFLHKNKMTEFPISLVMFSNLVSLTLDHNKLKTIPEGIVLLAKLEILTASHNQLEELPVSITRLRRLKMIDFTNNKLPVEEKRIEKSEKQCSRYLAEISKFFKKKQTEKTAVLCFIWCCQEENNMPGPQLPPEIVQKIAMMSMR